MIHQLHPPSQVLERLHGILIPKRTGLLFRCEHKVPPDHLAVRRLAELLRRFAINVLGGDNQGALDAEDRIGSFIRVVAEVESTITTERSVR